MLVELCEPLFEGGRSRTGMAERSRSTGGVIGHLAVVTRAASSAPAASSERSQHEAAPGACQRVPAPME